MYPTTTYSSSSAHSCAEARRKGRNSIVLRTVPSLAHLHGRGHQLRDEAPVETDLHLIARDGHCARPLHRRAHLRLMISSTGHTGNRGWARFSDDTTTLVGKGAVIAGKQRR